MKKTIIIFLFIFLHYHSSKAQTKNTTYYFVSGGDTVFCRALKYTTTIQGNLETVSYTDKSGNHEKMTNPPEISTFCLKGVIFDKVPLKAHKPEGYIRYTERVVDGKLKVYLTPQQYTRSADGSSSPIGIYRFYLKMPDGKYYKINSSKNMKEVIVPYISNCKSFTDQYKGRYTYEEGRFIEMIKLYNSLCAE